MSKQFLQQTQPQESLVHNLEHLWSDRDKKSIIQMKGKWLKVIECHHLLSVFSKKYEYVDLPKL